MNRTEGNKLLKSCPICKSKARIFIAPNGYMGVECDKIGCIMMPALFERSVERLVRDWNNRPYENKE